MGVTAILLNQELLITSNQHCWVVTPSKSNTHKTTHKYKYLTFFM